MDAPQHEDRDRQDDRDLDAGCGGPPSGAATRAAGRPVGRSRRPGYAAAARAGAGCLVSPGCGGRHHPSGTWSREWVGTLSDLGGVGGLLGWDRETLMPPAGAEGRARQMGTLAALHHRELVRPDVGEALARAGGTPDLDDEAPRDGAARHPRARPGAAGARGAGARAERGVLALRQRLGRRRARADDFAGLRRAPARRSSPSSGARPRRSASATSPTTRCSTSSSRAPAPPTWSRSSPTCGPASPPWSHGPRRAPAGGAPAARVERDRPDGHRPRDRAPGGLRRVGGRDRPVGPPLHRLAPPRRRPLHHPPRAREPDRQHQRGAARARPRALRAGLPRPRPTRTPVYDAPSLGAHESQSRFWENQIGHTRAFWEQIEPAMRRLFPEAMAGHRRRPAAPRRRASCGPR